MYGKHCFSISQRHYFFPHWPYILFIERRVHGCYNVEYTCVITYLRQHGLMSFILLNIPEREINLHFVNSAGQIYTCKMLISIFFIVTCILFKRFDWTDFIFNMQKNAPLCVLLNTPHTPLPLLVSRGLAAMLEYVSLLLDST